MAMAYNGEYGFCWSLDIIDSVAGDGYMALCCLWARMATFACVLSSAGGLNFLPFLGLGLDTECEGRHMHRVCLIDSDSTHLNPACMVICFSVYTNLHACI